MNTIINTIWIIGITLTFIATITFLAIAWRNEVRLLRAREDDLLNRLFSKDNAEYHKYNNSKEPSVLPPGTKNVLKEKFLKTNQREG